VQVDLKKSTRRRKETARKNVERGKGRRRRRRKRSREGGGKGGGGAEDKLPVRPSADRAVAGRGGSRRRRRRRDGRRRRREDSAIPRQLIDFGGPRGRSRNGSLRRMGYMSVKISRKRRERCVGVRKRGKTGEGGT